MTRGTGPTARRVRVEGLSEGRAYSASIEIFDIVGGGPEGKGEVSPEVHFTMAPPEAATPKITIGVFARFQCTADRS